MKKSMTQKEKDIIEALSIEGLPKAEQEELLLDLGDAIFRSSMLRMIERMDDATQADFEALLNRGASEDEVAAFIEARVPGADSAVQEAIDELRNDILAVTS